MHQIRLKKNEWLVLHEIVYFMPRYPPEGMQKNKRDSNFLANMEVYQLFFALPSLSTFANPEKAFRNKGLAV